MRAALHLQATCAYLPLGSGKPFLSAAAALGSLVYAALPLWLESLTGMMMQLVLEDVL